MCPHDSTHTMYLVCSIYTNKKFSSIFMSVAPSKQCVELGQISTARTEAGLSCTDRFRLVKRDTQGLGSHGRGPWLQLNIIPSRARGGGSINEISYTHYHYFPSGFSHCFTRYTKTLLYPWWVLCVTLYRQFPCARTCTHETCTCTCTHVTLHCPSLWHLHRGFPHSMAP